MIIVDQLLCPSSHTMEERLGVLRQLQSVMTTTRQNWCVLLVPTSVEQLSR